MSLSGIFGKHFKLYSCNNNIIILEYILGYLFNKNQENYYDIYIYMVYTHNNYCSTHFYGFYNKKQVVCNYSFTCYVVL
ncbi:hypothetical protein PFMALIP_05748 [Plasmodium falciparum MaliPS096_E11]|uniref:Uncharacterized protein n=1 Tax=Plasmodium falciparum MaliPS096_E11 TaxID=1036727 RepID=A0A024WGQ8_PLAFA|nr:hypothetical protein PFMALIP_05748 [Plasmodium falciparum MaliPS096_E11]